MQGKQLNFYKIFCAQHKNKLTKILPYYIILQSTCVMKIEVKKLNAQKRYNGRLDFEYEPSENSCLVPLCGIEGKVNCSAEYEIYSDDSVGVKLTVKYLLKGQCSYCLNDAQKFIERTFDILFVTADDRENYIYDGNSINLKTAVDDAILFSQPNILLCREDCTGIDIDNK